MPKHSKDVPTLPPRNDPSYSAQYQSKHWRKKPYKRRKDLTSEEKCEQRKCYNRLLRELNSLSNKIGDEYLINWVVHYPVVDSSKAIKLNVKPGISTVSYSTGAKTFVWLRYRRNHRQVYFTMIGAIPQIFPGPAWSERIRHRVRRRWRWHDFQFVFVTQGEGRLIKIICGPFVGNPEEHNITDSLRLARAGFNEVFTLHQATLPIIPSELHGFLNCPLKCPLCYSAFQPLPDGEDWLVKAEEAMTPITLSDPEPGEFLYALPTISENGWTHPLLEGRLKLTYQPSAAVFVAKPGDQVTLHGQITVEAS